MKYIPYGKQTINQDDIKSVLDTLQSDFITQGPLINKFENLLSKKVNSKYCAVMNSATSALHVSCLSLELSSNDLLWTVPNSFVASANCGLYCGAKIDFVDINLETGNMDVEKLKQTLENQRSTSKSSKKN